MEDNRYELMEDIIPQLPIVAQFESCIPNDENDITNSFDQVIGTRRSPCN